MQAAARRLALSSSEASYFSSSKRGIEIILLFVHLMIDSFAAAILRHSYRTSNLNIRDKISSSYIGKHKFLNKQCVVLFSFNRQIFSVLTYHLGIGFQCLYQCSVRLRILCFCRMKMEDDLDFQAEYARRKNILIQSISAILFYFHI